MAFITIRFREIIKGDFKTAHPGGIHLELSSVSTDT